MPRCRVSVSCALALAFAAVVAGQDSSGTDAAAVVERDVLLVHRPAAPAFAGTLTLPRGVGPHPAALLVSPAGDHPRDELRRGGRHWADLAARLAAAGIASLRIDNRGVGDSANEAWPEWSWTTSLDELVTDLASHVAWLRALPEIDANRVGVVAHGDGAIVAARAAVDHVPAFLVLLSMSGQRGLEDLVARQVARLPDAVGDEDRARFRDEALAAFEALVADGPTPAVAAGFATCMRLYGLPEEQAEAQGRAFAANYGERWHRDWLGARPRAAARALTGATLVLLAADDERLDAAASAAVLDGAFRSRGVFNARVVTVPQGGHFLEPDGDERRVLRDDVVDHVRRFVSDATGFLDEPELPPGVAAPDVLVLRDVHVVDVVDGVLRSDRTVVVRAGRITAVDSSRESPAVPAGAVVVDTRGGYVIPGLWDSHVHVTLWGADALARCVAHGVTTVRDLGGDLREQLAWRAAVERGDWLGPRLLLAGPFLDGPKPNDQYRRVVADPDALAAVLDELVDAEVDVLKVHSRLPPDVFRALGPIARERGLTVVGHVPVGLRPGAASDLGMHGIEHADTFFSALVRADDAPVSNWGEARGYWRSDAGREVLARVAANGTVVTPVLTPIAHVADRLGGMFAAIAPWTREMTASLHAHGVTLCAGTDFARRAIGIEPGASLHGELELLVGAGLTPAEALAAATVHAARAAGRDAIGRVAVGQVADLVVLRGNPLDDVRQTRAIEGVVLAGAWLPRDALDAVRAQVAAVRAR